MDIKAKVYDREAGSSVGRGIGQIKKDFLKTAYLIYIEIEQISFLSVYV